MEIKYLLKGLDCPHCASVIEREAAKIPLVKSAQVNLMKQTLVMEIEGENAGVIYEKVKEIVKRNEPEVEVSLFTESEEAECLTHEGTCGCDGHSHDGEDDGMRDEAVQLILGGMLFVPAAVCNALFRPAWYASLLMFLVPYLILGWKVIASAAGNLFKGRVFDENFLMSLSTVGAFAIGEYTEGAAVMLFYGIGEFLQDLSVRRSRKSIKSLLDIRPDTAAVERDGAVIEVHPEKVDVGEVIVVKPGEKVPLDGIVLQGSSSLDTKALTGESRMRDVFEGDGVLAGFINGNGVLRVRVTMPYAQSAASKIIDLVENASAKKARTENFITTFARYYTPAVVLFALLLAVIPPLMTGTAFSGWLYRALVFLVVSCPCALVISVPLAFFSGIGTASKNGILIKGSNYLEALNGAHTVVFDKTGTLTEGTFAVKDVIPSGGFTKERLLELAAAAESCSNHPIARSVLEYYGKEVDLSCVSDYKELPGYGVSVVTGGCKVSAGNLKLMQSEGAVIDRAEKDASAAVHIAVVGAYAGCITVCDRVKDDSAKTIAELKKLGIKRTVMLTGDSADTAREVAKELGIDECFSGLLPHEKVEVLEKLDKEKRGKEKIIYVGDGINDAPVLARADVGVAMGALGSDAAIEAADVVLMTDEPAKLVQAIQIARTTKFKVLRNIVLALSVKVIILILGALGIADMWTAVFGDVGVTLIAVLLSL